MDSSLSGQQIRPSAGVTETPVSTHSGDKGQGPSSPSLHGPEALRWAGLDPFLPFSMHSFYPTHIVRSLRSL